MQSYDELNAKLEVRYRALAEERDGAPVYAIEHGFNEEDVRNLTSTNALRLREMGAVGPGIAWPLLALTAEIGYAYRGLLSGYWPHLEAALGLSLLVSARPSVIITFVRTKRVEMLSTI